MTSLRRLGGPLTIALAVAQGACSTAEEAGGGAPDHACYYGCGDGSGGSAGSSGAGQGGTVLDASGDAPWVSPLCGKGSCDPDFEQACSPSGAIDAGAIDAGGDAAMADAASEASDDATGEPDDDASSGADASFDDDGSADDDASIDAAPSDDAASDDDGPAPGDADADADAAAGDANDDALFTPADAGAPANPPPSAMACHVEPTSSGPTSMCGPAGTGQAGAACDSSSDCAPGLGCVGTANAGECQPYCCGDPENCPKQTYCTPRPSRDDAASPSPMMVPACVPATPCTLLEPQPCAAQGLVCGLVRADGTTSCVPAGTGQLDEPCPCAFGFVCAKSTNKCLKLCHTGQGSTECPGGTCQGGAGGLPAGFGVCVGAVGDGG